MNQIFLILFLLSSAFNAPYSSNLSSNKKQTAEVKLQAPIIDLSNFKLITKKLQEDVVNKISATNVLIKEIGGATIYEKNSEEIKPIASITKMMTSLIAYEIYPEVEKFKISAKAVSVEGEAGNFSAGEVFKRNDLVKTTLIASSNDAAYALAEKTGTEKFVEFMNSKTKALGMKETQYFDSTGLSNKNKSSLKDLYKLTDYISRTYPEILNFSRIEKFTLMGDYKRVVESTDYLLPFYKNYIVASKTGFTDEAGECLLLVLKFEKSPFIFVGLLNSKNRFEDAEKLILALEEYYK